MQIKKEISAHLSSSYGAVLDASASELTQGTMGFHVERDGSQYNH